MDRAFDQAGQPAGHGVQLPLRSSVAAVDTWCTAELSMACTAVRHAIADACLIEQPLRICEHVVSLSDA